MYRRFSNIACALALAAISSACQAIGPFAFSSGELSGTVVDADTNEGVSGALVVAIWKIEKPRLFHGTDHKFFHTLETFTDAAGHFHFDAWGPISKELFWDLSGSSPNALIWREGYKLGVLRNYFPAFGGDIAPGAPLAAVTDLVHTESLVVVSWNGIVTKLQRSNENATSTCAFLRWTFREQVCGWDHPEQCSSSLMEFLDKERQRLKALGAARCD
jgi:hypothetical protein